MTTRYDVRAVPLQGGYVAKQCPVRAQFDLLQPGERAPDSPLTERRFAAGRAFEKTVTEQLQCEATGVVVIARGDLLQRERDTVAAMRAGARLISGGRLPADTEGRRVGEPDLLVAARGGGYRPVDIKHHGALDRRRPDTSLPPVSPLHTPGREDAVAAESGMARHEEDALQLAHYQRMLEAGGFAAADGRWAGIIGTEGLIVWYDLDEPRWRTPSLTSRTALRSTMERYDFEFDFRLDVIAASMRHREDPGEPLLVVPVRCTDCPECPWRNVCMPRLNEGSGDVSLIPYVTWKTWKVHRDRGIRTRAQLAALDAAAAAPLYEGSGITGLAEQIDQARAALGVAPVYRRRGVERCGAPRADIEVDVDMENVEAGCYLWGTLLTDRQKSGDFHEGYRAFATWDPLHRESEAANTQAFWEWLMEVRRRAHRSGLTFRAYCYSARAENTYLLRLAQMSQSAEEIEEFIASDEWVDLLRTWNEQMITGGSSGLKRVSEITGFRWDVDEPGGALSMMKYDDAVGCDAAARDRARRWLLTYNRGDVEATRALRDWLESAGAAAPSIERWTPPLLSPASESRTTGSGAALRVSA